MGSECTRIDLSAFRFQNFSWGVGWGIPLGPLDWCGFIVSCQPPIPKYLLMPLICTTLSPCSYQSNTANTSLDTILSIQPKDSSSGGGETRESVVYKQAAEMLEKLPPNYIPHEVKARLQKMGAIAPMNIFLRQEIDRMQRVITIVRNTLTDLRLAIEGTIIMSEVRHFNVEVFMV